MKSEKPKRNVADMDVLKDIRGLLSTTQERNPPREAGLKEEADLKAEIAQYKEEIGRLRELAQNQQGELKKLRRENEELVANSNLLRSGEVDVPISPGTKVEELNRQISQLEARKSELSSALSEVEGLLQLKLEELLKRIARVYQETGESGAATEFRRAADHLRVEDFAYFLRALLGE